MDSLSTIFCQKGILYLLWSWTGFFFFFLLFLFWYIRLSKVYISVAKNAHHAQIKTDINQRVLYSTILCTLNLQWNHRCGPESSRQGKFEIYLFRGRIFLLEIWDCLSSALKSTSWKFDVFNWEFYLLKINVLRKFMTC